ncbi:MAG: LD-carboxypeptidase [Bacteroidales bacterium]|jgi:muramoyltetrapeptide carboxypeptidase|nr:LD-carboxypeptidase [Bacteroidales bacterium]
MIEETVMPPFLKRGDKVAVVSPSGVAEPEPVMKAMGIIEGWGLKAVGGRHLLARNGIFAGTDEERLEDLQQALDDSEVRALFCSRGGYGLSRVIDRIDFTGFLASPKWIVGFSDVTLLHLWVNTLFGIATVHGEMPAYFSDPEKSERTLSSLRNLLFGWGQEYRWNARVCNPSTATGVITGGNLSLLYSLAGTIGRPATEGRILFIEDTGEYHYSLDRMLSSLRISGMLDNLSALLAGSFTGMQDGKIPYGKEFGEIITDIAGRFGYPVYLDFPAGHDSDNMSLWLGRRASLTYTEGVAELKYL